MIITTESDEWEMTRQVFPHTYSQGQEDSPAPVGPGWEPFATTDNQWFATVWWRRRKQQGTGALEACLDAMKRLPVVH